MTWLAIGAVVVVVVVGLVALELRRRVDRRWDEVERRWRDRNG